MDGPESKDHSGPLLGILASHWLITTH